MTNERMLYLGAVLLIVSLGAGLLAAIVMRVRKVRLRKRLNQEYGVNPRGKKDNKA